MYKIDNLEVEYNDPHKHACKLYGFPYTYLVNQHEVGHFMEWLHKNGRPRLFATRKKAVQFRGMFVWIILFYFQIIYLTICI